MRLIRQRELRNNSAAVLNAVETGETYHITRHGREVAELRPLPGRQRLTSEELIERLHKLPRVDHTQMRQETDEFFGTEDRVRDEAWEPGRVDGP